jgi:hypothetical protein
MICCVYIVVAIALISRNTFYIFGVLKLWCLFDRNWFNILLNSSMCTDPQKEAYFNCEMRNLRKNLKFSLYRFLVYSGFGLDRFLVYSGFGLDRFLFYSGFGLDKFLVYSGFGLDRFLVYSGFGLDGFLVYSGFGLDRFLVYSGFDLDRFHGIYIIIISHHFILTIISMY